MTAEPATKLAENREPDAFIDPIQAWRAELKKAASIQPFSMEQVTACIRRQAFGEAVEHLQGVREAAGDDPDALYLIAILYLELGELDSATEAFDACFRLGGDVSKNLGDLVSGLLRWFGSADHRAIDSYTRTYRLAALTAQPNSAVVAWYMGTIAAVHERNALAACWLELCRILDDTLFASRLAEASDATTGIVADYYLAGESPYLPKTVADRPRFQRYRSAPARPTSGGELGYWDHQARDAIDLVMRDSGNDPDVLMELGEALHSGGAIREAISIYHRVLNADPKHERARIMLQQLPDIANPAIDDLMLVRFDNDVQKAASADYIESRKADFYYNIDIVGSCNLRCPSCPVGNSWNEDIPRGMMKLETYERIIAKIKVEHPADQKVCIDIHNWGESLLHPDLPKFIEVTKAAGFGCGLSSNFNHNLSRKRLQEILNAKPDSLRVSLSGFSNEAHQFTHRRGDINIVKSNLYLLRYMLDRLKSETKVEVGYMVYKHNFGQDFVQVRKLCDELRFRFDWIFAVYMPVEKTIEANYGECDSNDADVVAQLVIEPDVWKNFADQSEKFRVNKPGDCHLKKFRMAINFDGTVPICCASYSYENHVAPDFLDVPHDELQKRRDEHSLCDKCIKSSAYFLYSGVHPRAAEVHSYDNLNRRGAFIGKDGR